MGQAGWVRRHVYEQFGDGDKDINTIFWLYEHRKARIQANIKQDHLVSAKYLRVRFPCSGGREYSLWELCNSKRDIPSLNDSLVIMMRYDMI